VPFTPAAKAANSHDRGVIARDDRQPLDVRAAASAPVRRRPPTQVFVMMSELR
jgi:hypothetical protein